MTLPWEDESLAANGLAVKDNFADWFGESVVRDVSGAPLMVYHGTNSDFDAFRISRSGEFGPGIYFTSSIAEANSYLSTHAGRGNAGQNIVPAYLSLQNPFVVSKGSSEFWDRFQAEDDAACVQMAQEQGFDGVMFQRPVQVWMDGAIRDTGEMQTHFVVFQPRQVKSALGNSGLYLKDSESITDAQAHHKLMAAHRARNASEERRCLEMLL